MSIKTLLNQKKFLPVETKRKWNQFEMMEPNITNADIW